MGLGTYGFELSRSRSGGDFVLSATFLSAALQREHKRQLGRSTRKLQPETGGQWKDLWLGLKKACRKADLHDVTWHTFRHTFASRLTRAGADLVTVKELLGHSTISVTMRYAHTNRDAKTRAVRLQANRSDKVMTVAGSVKKPA